jgi:hypothetical protein
MVKELKAARLLRERELILEALRAQQRQGCRGESDPVDSVVLRNVLSYLGVSMTRPELAEQIRYLEEKGYIATEERSLAELKTVLVEITPKGQDVLDGLVQDPTIIAP